MTDLNELRIKFEKIDEVSKILIEDGDIIKFDHDMDCYKSIYTDFIPDNVYFLNGAWFIFSNKSKSQAVPEGYVLVAKEIPDNVVSCLENSDYHWGEMTRDHYAPIYSLMVEVASESGT